MAKKSYYLKTKKGHVASVTFEGTKKPSKEMIQAISKAVELAFKKKIP